MFSTKGFLGYPVFRQSHLVGLHRLIEAIFFWRSGLPLSYSTTSALSLLQGILSDSTIRMERADAIVARRCKILFCVPSNAKPV